MEAIFNEREKSTADVVQVPQGYVVFEWSHQAPHSSFEEIVRCGIRVQERACQLLVAAKDAGAFRSAKAGMT